MERYEESIQSLKASLQQGLDELQAGKGIRIQSADDLDQLFEEIKRACSAKSNCSDCP